MIKNYFTKPRWTAVLIRSQKGEKQDIHYTAPAKLHTRFHRYFGQYGVDDGKIKEEEYDDEGSKCKGGRWNQNSRR